MNPKMRYIIIGAGAAGVAAGEAIRSCDETGEIVLVSEEPESYYSRPGLAYVLTGEVSLKQLFPFSDADFRRLNIQRLNRRAMRVDSVAHQIEFQDGHKLTYDRLLIATGSTAAKAKVPGIDVNGVVKLDNIADARQILHLARRARSAVVVGGGITALEIVEGLLSRGIKPDYFLRGDRYWSNVLDEHESHIVEHRLKEEGVRIHYHTELAEVLSKKGQIVAVRTRDGRELRCDLLAVAIGVLPQIEIAKNSGIRIDHGIWVDETLQTSDLDVYAAGDVAEPYDPQTGQSLMNTLWPLARDMGRVAGHNMAVSQFQPGNGLNSGAPYKKTVPFNVTRLAGLTTTIIGMVGRGRDEDMVGIARGDSETWRQLPDAIAAQSDFAVNHLRLLINEQNLVGAIIMGDQTLSRPLQVMIDRNLDISPIREKLLDPGDALADTLAEFWSKVHAG